MKSVYHLIRRTDFCGRFRQRPFTRRPPPPAETCHTPGRTSGPVVNRCVSHHDSQDFSSRIGSDIAVRPIRQVFSANRPIRELAERFRRRALPAETVHTPAPAPGRECSHAGSSEFTNKNYFLPNSIQYNTIQYNNEKCISPRSTGCVMNR